MRKIKLFGVALMAVMVLASCGGASDDSKTEQTEDSSQSKSIKPKSVSLKGDLKDYFEVVDKDYKIKIEENSYSNDGMLTIEIKRNNKDFDFETGNINPFGTNGSEDYHVGFGIEIFDESGPVVIKSATEGGMGGPYSSEDVTGLINLNKGESGYIRWSIRESQMKGLESFQITSALQAEEHQAFTGSDFDEDDFSNSSNSGSTDWDAVLQSYEQYINQYIKLLKKANNGDASAATEYISMMEKANDLTNKMSNAGNELSSTQMAKFIELQTKLANAAASL